VSNPVFNGIGLHFVDAQGFDTAQLTQLALAARLGATPSHAEVFDLFFVNLFGQAPDAATRAAFVDQLDRGAFTPTSLGVLVADSDLNKSLIDFVGLTRNGLEYQPYPA
jgi:hypothetical protein